MTVDDQLTKLMDYYGSDKGGKSNHHNYTNYYSELFLYRKNEIKNFLEVGLGTNNQNFLIILKTKNIIFPILIFIIIKILKTIL